MPQRREKKHTRNKNPAEFENFRKLTTTHYKQITFFFSHLLLPPLTREFPQHAYQNNQRLCAFAFFITSTSCSITFFTEKLDHRCQMPTASKVWASTGLSVYPNFFCVFFPLLRPEKRWKWEPREHGRGSQWVWQEQSAIKKYWEPD